MQPESFIHRYDVSYLHGLTSEQVARRKQENLVNHQPPDSSKSMGQIISDNVVTLFNILNILIFLAVLLVGSYRNTLFMVIILSNIAIGVIQEIRAKRIVAKLSLLSAAHVVVLRDGEQSEVAVDEVVLDDVMLLQSGRQIVADAVVIDGEVEVNEALLTGEADPMMKRTGDVLLSGSFVVAGTCYARAEHVGSSNFSYQITAEGKKHKKLRSELMESLKQIIKFNSFIIIPLGIAMFCKAHFLLDRSLTDAVVNTGAAMIGMIPEGLMLLTSVSLAVSVIKLAQKQTLVQELYCIEMLSRVDVLCLDKTGTLTEGRMAVSAVAPLRAASALPRSLEETMSAFVRCVADSNATFQALAERFAGESSLVCRRKTPFSSARKWSAAVFEHFGSVVVGAPEFLLAAEARESAEIKGILEEAASSCSRTVLVAHTADEVETELPSSLSPIALITFVDAIRPEANETLAFFAQQDVEIKVISGDAPTTVAHVAARTGVMHADAVVDMSAIKSDQELAQAAAQYTIFARVAPDQKKKLIVALKEQGHTVAMVGDGVNDVMALREADCSVAMACGSDAARQVSQIVLLHSDFTALPSVVMEGRRVINNIMRTASLFMVKTLYSFLLSLLTLVAHFHYPFEPIQLSLIGTLTVGVPAFLLAFEPNKARIQGRFIVNVLKNALPGALAIVLNIVTIMALSGWLGLSYIERSTLCVYSTGFVGLVVLLYTCMPLNIKRACLWGAMTICFFAAAYLLRGLLGISVLDADMVWLFAALAGFAYPLIWALRMLLMKVPWIRKL